MMPPKQPKINQKLVLRTAIGMLVLAALIFGFQYLRGRKKDLTDIGTVNSAGWIAAVEQEPEGSRVVYFDANHDIHRSPEHKEGSLEEDPLWRPDGNRIYFSSDKKDGIFQIYRWNLATGAVENRAPSHVSRTSPAVDPFDDNGLLFLQSGLGYKLDVLSGKSTRVFPPVEHNRDEKEQQDEDATAPQSRGGFDYGMGERYKLKRAKWLDRHWLLGVQRLENGEALIAQTTDLRENSLQPFILLVSGKKVMFDIVPDTGEIMCGVAGFEFNANQPVPQTFVKNGKVEKPFKFVLFKGKLEDYVKGFAEMAQHHILMASQKDNEGFSDLKISPDGKWVAICLAESDPDQVVRPTSLVVYPVDPKAGQPSGLLQAPVYDPTWSPDSETLAFTIREGENQLVYTIARTGGEPKRISPDHGIFTTPKFSPQVEKP